MTRRREERRRRREEQRRAKKREHGAARQRAGGQGIGPEHGRAAPSAGESFALTPPGLERCSAPIHVDGALQRVEDPLSRLGLTEELARDPERVRAAWRRGIEAHPPEREPELARLLTVARDRLLAPDQVLARHLGVLHVPDPAAHGLPPEPARAAATRSVKLSAHARLLSQLALYVLLEDELEHGGSSAARCPGLPFTPSDVQR